MSLLRISNSFRNWMIVWGMLIVGHVAGLLLYCGLPTAYESVWLMVMLPISAIAFAAIGPLSIVLFFLTLFRVQGGTATALASSLDAGFGDSPVTDQFASDFARLVRANLDRFV